MRKAGVFGQIQACWHDTKSSHVCAGAGHYAAANACLDAAARQRHQMGRPATALQFGPFSRTGMAASHVATLAALGLHGMQPEQVGSPCSPA